MSSTPHAGRTIAWFDSLEEVRDAELQLERSGIDAVNISVKAIDSVDHRRDMDNRTWGWIGRRAAIGVVIGVVIGALIGLFAGWQLDSSTSELWLYAMGGAVFGAAPGFFYNVGARLPAEAATFDTFADDADDDVWIAVAGPPETREKAVDVLSALHPTRISESV